MLQSIFSLGQNVVRRILPFGTFDLDEDIVLGSDNVLSPAEFLQLFRKLSHESASSVNEEDLVVALESATLDWYKVLVAKDGLLVLLNASSPASQKLLNGLIFRNAKFQDAVVANSSDSSHQLAAGVRETATIRRHVYLLLVALGMHSYEGYVMIYKTVNLLQRERPMFQYIADEISEATQPGPQGTETRAEDLIPPLALMVVLFAGGNGFFIESQLRHQIQSSRLLTSLVDIAQSKFVEEKHNRRLELPTLKEPAPRECTPQISRAIEILEQAERSRCDKILGWLEKFANEGDLAGAPEFTSKAPSGEPPVPVPPPRHLREASPGIPSVPQSASTLPPSPAPAVLPAPTLPIVPPAMPNAPSAPAPPVAPNLPSVSPSAVANSTYTTQLSASSADVGQDVGHEMYEKHRPVAEVHPMAAVSGSAPPAPPPPPVTTVNGVVQDAKIARSLLKPLRWTKLDTSEDVVAKSIWDSRRPGPRLDLTKLESAFKNEAVNAKFRKLQDKMDNPDGTEHNDSLSPQTELHFNVLLKQFPDIAVEDLARHIINLDTSEFDESQLKEFIAALPTDHEMENISKLDPNTSLKPAERFLYTLKDVDHMELRLKLMLFVVEYPVTERSLRKNCEDVVNACRIIQSSDSFHDFLQVVLQVGNKMNEGRAIGDARAFETSILPKLADVASAVPGYSLLHYLVHELEDSNPDTLKFVDEFQPVMEVARIPLAQMKSELLSEREKFGQLLEELQEASPEVQKAAEKLLQGVRAKLNSLTNVVVAAQQRTQYLAMYLMEDPATFQMHEFIEMLGNFTNSVRHIKDAPIHRSGSVSQSDYSREHADQRHTGSNMTEPPSYASPLMRDPRTASVFQSLRNELSNKLVLDPNV